jgi:RNA polymerase sigma factor (TIGR02999 family)
MTTHSHPSRSLTHTPYPSVISLIRKSGLSGYRRTAVPLPRSGAGAWMPRVSDVTGILASVEDPQAAEKLLPLVYDELRRLAAHRMAAQPPDHTLQATALVHEAYLRLLGNGEHTWQNRRHFFAAAAEAMRHILVDRARRKAAVRHGGGRARLNLDDVLLAADASDDAVMLVNDALEKLAVHDSSAAELVKLRFFAGLTLAQAAELIGCSERTAKRIWAYARAWLYQEIQDSV